MYISIREEKKAEQHVKVGSDTVLSNDIEQ